MVTSELDYEKMSRIRMHELTISERSFSDLMTYFYFNANDKLELQERPTITTKEVAFIMRKILSKITRRCNVERSNRLRVKPESSEPTQAEYQYGHRNHFDFIMPTASLNRTIGKKKWTDVFQHAFTPIPELTEAYKDASAFRFVRIFCACGSNFLFDDSDN